MDTNQLKAVVDAADRASIEGRHDEATRLLSLASSSSPDNPFLIGASGALALRAGRYAEARELLERAIGLEPTSAVLHVNLATALRELGDSDAEMASLQKALAIDPYLSAAIFQKASLYEKLGKQRQAATAYQAALSSLRPGDQLPVAWRSMIEHAQAVVQANMRELEEWLHERTRDARRELGTATLDRFDDYVAIFLGKKRVYVQQPLSTYFPRLPAIEYFNRDLFPWLPSVEAATDAIRAELQGLLDHSLEDFQPYLTHPPDAPLNQWKELNHSHKWSALFVLKDGERVEPHASRCPQTLAALAGAPLARVPGHAPSAFFSRLEPRTHIPPHTGVTNTRSIVHLPLVIPPGCRFRVGSEVREWSPGTGFVFDDTIEHEAWNDSDQPRVILIFDVWNPLMTAAECNMVAVATGAMTDYYGDSAGSDRFV